MSWTLEEARELCRKIEAVCPEQGCHVALTGGVLYKDAPRKDLDLLFYRVRQADHIDGAGLMQALVDLGIKLLVGGTGGWLMKAEYQGKKIDFFFPENEGGDYPCSCTHEAGDSRCLAHPMCNECGADTERPVDSCKEHSDV